MTLILASALFFPLRLDAQTTAFNFQGRLNDGTSPANGRYDLQFKLFPAITGGSQVGSTVDRPNLLLVNGVFSTTLDFGASAITSGDRFVEISVRPNGSPNAHFILGARQQIMSVPFAVRSANATQADNATNAQNADNATTAQNSNALGGFAPGSYARLNVANPGNVAFGTVAPNTRLTLSGGPAWTSNNWTASMNMQNASALGWEANASGQRFGIGQTDNGLYFFRTYAAFGQTIPPANVDLQINDNGNLAQPPERNGLVKMMAAITADGSIARCYNGVTGSVVMSCGLSIITGAPGAGHYFIDFPFQVSNRFWLVTNADSTNEDQTSTVYPEGNFRLRVTRRLNGSNTSLPFHLFVF